MFNCGVYFLLEGLSIFYCQATAVWNCRGFDFRKCPKSEVPAPRITTKEQAPGKYCMKSSLEKFFCEASSESQASSYKKGGKRKQSALMKIWFERIVILANSCYVKEWILIFCVVSLPFFLS